MVNLTDNDKKRIFQFATAALVAVTLIVLMAIIADVNVEARRIDKCTTEAK